MVRIFPLAPSSAFAARPVGKVVTLVLLEVVFSHENMIFFQEISLQIFATVRIFYLYYFYLGGRGGGILLQITDHFLKKSNR